jgi:hypothetical protein
LIKSKGRDSVAATIAKGCGSFDGLYPRIFAYFGPPARVVVGFLTFLFFHVVAMHMK